MAAPPSLVGAVQLKSMVVCPSAAAVSEVGTPGAVAAAVVAFAVLELGPIFVAELIARTR